MTNKKLELEKFFEIIDYLEEGKGSRAELEEFAKSYKTERGILQAICRHPKVTGKLLAAICKESDSLFFLSMATKNPKLPPGCMYELYVKVKRIAAEDALNSGMLVDGSLEIQRNFARNPKCPKRLLDKIADHYDVDTKAIVASNPNISADTVLKLRKYRSIKVKKALDQNPAIR